MTYRDTIPQLPVGTTVECYSAEASLLNSKSNRNVSVARLQQNERGLLGKVAFFLWRVSVDIQPLMRGFSQPYSIAYHDCQELSAKEKAEIRWFLMGL